MHEQKHLHEAESKIDELQQFRRELHVTIERFEHFLNEAQRQ